MLLKLNLAPVINGFSVVDFVKKKAHGELKILYMQLPVRNALLSFSEHFCIRTCDVSSVYLFKVKTFEKDFVALGISYYATYYEYVQYAS